VNPQEIKMDDDNIPDQAFMPGVPTPAANEIRELRELWHQPSFTFERWRKCEYCNHEAETAFRHEGTLRWVCASCADGLADMVATEEEQ
jgi:hypothetical protein